jgi:FkbM family methyltransferase
MKVKSMSHIKRPVPFVLISSNHGTMIINRNDHYTDPDGNSWGVGYQLLNTGSFDHQEVDFIIALLERRRKYFGDGVVALDCGANIGVHTIEFARAMYGWGEVLAFEAQEKLFYALAGNVVINNCLNVSARHSAVGAYCGQIEIPEPDYLVPSSFSSLELKESDKNEFIGQKIDYKKTKTVSQVSVDSLRMQRLDLMKLDVEGMEEEVLKGAAESIAKHSPVMMIEVLKTHQAVIEGILSKTGYRCYPLGYMLLAVHSGDPLGKNIKTVNGALSLGSI